MLAYTIIDSYIILVEFNDPSKLNENISNTQTFKIKDFIIREIKNYNGETFKKIPNYAVNKKYCMYISVCKSKENLIFSNFKKYFPNEYNTFTGYIKKYRDDGNIDCEYFMNNGKINGVYKSYYYNRDMDENSGTYNTILSYCKELYYIDDKLHGTFNFKEDGIHFDVCFDNGNMIDYSYKIIDNKQLMDRIVHSYIWNFTHIHNNKWTYEPKVINYIDVPELCKGTCYYDLNGELVADLIPSEKYILKYINIYFYKI